jgi:hypothetical protein
VAHHHCAVSNSGYETVEAVILKSFYNRFFSARRLNMTFQEAIQGVKMMLDIVPILICDAYDVAIGVSFKVFCGTIRVDYGGPAVERIVLIASSLTGRVNARHNAIVIVLLNPMNE